MKQKIQKLLWNMWLWVGVAILLLAVLAISFVGKTTERIFDYVPQSANQAFVIKVNPKNTLLYKNYMQNLPGDIETLFAQMDIVVITQKTVETVPENLIFVQAKPDFKAQDLADSMNGTGDVQYVYQKLEKNLYVFGKPDSLKYLKLDTKNSFFAVEKLKPMAYLLKNSELSFFSHVAANLDVSAITPFIGNMEYFVYGIDTEGEKMNMEARLMYKENKKLDSTYSFKPLFKWYANDKTLLFLEFWKVLQQFGIDKETIMANFQALLPMWGITDLTPEDYETMYSALSNNIWLLLGEWNNLAGVGLSLLFRNSPTPKDGQDFFSVLSKMMPVAHSFVSTLPFLSGSSTSVVNDVSKQWFSAQVMWVQDVWLYAQKQGDDTLLTLWDPSIERDGKLDVEYSSQTLWYFKINFTPIINLYTRFKTTFAALSPLGQAVAEEDFSFFKDKSLIGQIIAHEEGVTIKATLE